MNKTVENIENLLAKIVSGNATKKEMEQLDEWMNKSLDNEKIIQKSKKAWEISQNQILPETEEHDKSEVLRQTQKQNSLQLLRTRRQLLIYKIAAIIAIPLTFAISSYFINSHEYLSKAAQICQISAPKGHVSKCKLPDGTEVWINTGSTLTYNTSSFNEKFRDVELEGEAYFQVTKNKEKPFHVLTPIANINVTGTSFNVKAYPESDAFETVLAEGNIEMQLNNYTHQIIHIIPGEKAVYKVNEKGILIEKVDPEIFSSWRNGKIIFKDATLNDLVKELERIYDIQFHLKDPKLGEYRFRGMFSYNNNLIDALEKIKRTAEIDYYIENKEVWLSKK